jgi:hypothetical protein
LILELIIVAHAAIRKTCRSAMGRILGQTCRWNLPCTSDKKSTSAAAAKLKKHRFAMGHVGLKFLKMIDIQLAG